MKLEHHYKALCETPSDMNEHLPTLMHYASECKHVTEMGVRAVVSTYGLMMGKPAVMRSYDIVPIEAYGVDTTALTPLGVVANALSVPPLS